MSSLAIGSKIFGGVIATTTVVGGSYFLTLNLSNKQKTLHNVNVPTIFVVSENIVPEELTEKNKLQDYKCQIANESQQPSIDLSCKVFVLMLEDNSKKHIKHSDLNKKNWETPTLDIIGKANHVFKVEVKQDLYKTLTGDNPKTIEIVSKKIGNKKLATLKTLFGINGSDVNFKSQYSIAKVQGFSVSNNSDTNVSAKDITIKTEGNKCLFAGENDKNNGINCSIYKFADNQSSSLLDSLTFNTDTNNKVTEIHAGSYYLFKYDDESSSKIYSDFKSDATTKIWLSESVTKGDVNNIDNISLSNLLPAIMIEHSGSNLIFSFLPGTNIS